MQLCIAKAQLKKAPERFRAPAKAAVAAQEETLTPKEMTWAKRKLRRLVTHIRAMIRRGVMF